MNTPPYVPFSQRVCVLVTLNPIFGRPNAVITMVSSLATKMHKTLHPIQTDECMVWVHS